MSKNEQKLDQLLMDVGLREVLSGTEYIRQAVKLYEPRMSLTKELYPAIAQAVGSTPSRVERAMRHAIETAFDRSRYDTMYAFFGNAIDPNSGKVTNGEFVARLARIYREGLGEN